MIKAVVTTKGVDEAVRAVLTLAKPATRRKAIRVGARAANDGIKTWYRSKGRNHWSDKSGPTHGPGRKASGWWRGTSRWVIETANESGATMTNGHIGLAHKITGGTITAKRKSALTIPLHPRAHSLSAQTFRQTIAPLFRVKSILAMSDGNGGIIPVYALKKSVTQKPWPNALPPEGVYVSPFEDSVLDVIEDSFQTNA